MSIRGAWGAGYTFTRSSSSAFITTVKEDRAIATLSGSAGFVGTGQKANASDKQGSACNADGNPVR